MTDSGIQFANRKSDHYAFKLLRYLICEAHGIEHRLTRRKYPWIDGQVERMIHTLKEAAVYRYFYDSNKQISRHLHTFVMVYNIARRRETLNGLTVYKILCKLWQEQPKRFHSYQYHLTLGLNS